MTGKSESPAPAEIAEPKVPAKSTHFLFEHKVFSVPGSYFAIAGDTGDATFFVPLGNVQGVLSFSQLKSGFNLAEDSSDASLLPLVEKGLAFVGRIHPGDSIPSELLDGTASWKVEDRHRAIAEARLRVQLGTWMAGNEKEVRDVSEILRLANDPDIRERMQEAVTAIAERLGIGRERRVEVLDRVERLARELSYIEALRDRVVSVKMIVMKLGQLSAIYGPERGFSEEIKRVLFLMRKPVAEFDAVFAQVDGQTGEIVNVLANFETQVEFIRSARDDLHRKLMPWTELIERWQGLAVALGTDAETLLRLTYRFMARQFPQTTDWQLQYGNLGKPGR